MQIYAHLQRIRGEKKKKMGTLEGRMAGAETDRVLQARRGQRLGPGALKTDPLSLAEGNRILRGTIH